VRDTKVWIWIVGVVCGVELLAIAVVGSAGVGAFFGLEGALVMSIGAGASVVTIRSLIARRSQPRSG